MALLSLIPYNTKIDFVKARYFTFVLSAFIILGSLGTWALRGLSMGVDFKGGIVMELRTPDKADVAAMRASLNSLKLGDVKIQEFGSNQDIMVRIERQEGGEAAQLEAIQRVKEVLGSDIEYRRVDTVGPKVGDDLKYNALMAFLFAVVAMLIYIWVRFEWHFGICSIIGQLHDCTVVIGFYAISQLEFNETALIAILTTLSYSINGTVVIYDRIRENLRKYKKMDVGELVNLSINTTLTRTLLTSFTMLLALFALYFFGGNVISTFVLPIIVGIVLGTFSSVCLAPTLLLFFDLRASLQREKVGPEIIDNV